MATTLEEAVAHGRGVERPFNCPSHDDGNASASVNVQLGVWTCYACGASGRVSDHEPDPKAIKRLLEEHAAPERVMAEAWLDLFDAHLEDMDWSSSDDYWAIRYDTETARHFRCGLHPLSNLPTYPIRDLSGRVLGVVERGDDPKYRYPRGVRTSRTFFSSANRLQRCSSAVVLVEGAADVMALHHAGLPPGWQALGCFGSGLHAPQTEALLESAPKIVVIAFDNDDAGRAATARAEQALSDGVTTVTHVWSANDPGDVPRDERIPQLVATHHHGRKP